MSTSPGSGGDFTPLPWRLIPPWWNLRACSFAELPDPAPRIARMDMQFLPALRPLEELVYRVDDVELTCSLRPTARLQVFASGTVSSAGWISPALYPFVYVVPPADGILDFAFYAIRPSDPAPAVLTPVEARYDFHALFSGIRGVRVHAGSNHIERLLPAGACMVFQMDLSSLVGKKLIRLRETAAPGRDAVLEEELPGPLRVFTPSMRFGDMAFIPTRLNLVIDDSAIIQMAYYG